MIVNAVHVTERHVANQIAARMQQGQHGLLHVPPHLTIGGCFWASVLPGTAMGNVVHLEVPKPYSGRNPIHPVRLRLRIDLLNPMTFTIRDMARIHAEILLGLTGNAPGMTSLRAVCAHAGPAAGAGAIVDHARNMHRAPAHLATLVDTFAGWLAGPTPDLQHCPLDAPYFGLTAGQFRSVFAMQSVTAAQAQLWQEVGRRVGAGGGTGLIQLPPGCYLSRSGAGYFALVRNMQVQHLVRIENSPAEIVDMARQVTGHLRGVGDLA